jgi:cyanate permease
VSAFGEEVRHGWRNLLAATIGIACGVAGYIPLTSLFFRALEGEFAWSKTASAASLLSLPLTAAILPFAGRLVDRIGVRAATAISSTFTVAAFVWLSRLSGSKTEFYSAYLVLNVLGCATGPLAYTRLIVGDFRKARGIALAVALLGIALAASALPPLVQTIIGRFGWRQGYEFFATLSLGGGFSAVLIMHPQSVSVDAPVRDGGWRQSIKSKPFWILGIAILLISAGVIGLVSQLQSVLVEKGVSREVAAWLLSVLGISVGLSRLVIGRLLDLRAPARSVCIVIAVACLGPIVLLLGLNRTELLALGVSLVAIAAGAELDVMAYFCSRLFDVRNYGTLYGGLFSFHYVGMAAGALTYGAIHDRTGQYTGALAFTCGALTLAAALFQALHQYINRQISNSALVERVSNAPT